MLSSSIALASHLQDYAKVISPEVASRLEKLLGEIESKKGLYIEEVILPNRDGQSLESIESTYIKRLEQTNSTVDKRVLLLIVLDENFAKLYTSENLSKTFNAKSSNDIIANVTMRLSEKHYDEMARVGIAGIYHYFEASQPKQKSNTILNIIFFLLAIGAAIAIAIYAPGRKNN